MAGAGTRSKGGSGRAKAQRPLSQGRNTPERAAMAATLRGIRTHQRAVNVAERYPQRFAGATDRSAVDARSRFLARHPEVIAKSRAIKGRVAKRAEARAESQRLAGIRARRADQRAGKELDFSGKPTGGKYPMAKRVADAKRDRDQRRKGRRFQLTG